MYSRASQVSSCTVPRFTRAGRCLVGKLPPKTAPILGAKHTPTFFMCNIRKEISLYK